MNEHKNIEESPKKKNSDINSEDQNNDNIKNLAGYKRLKDKLETSAKLWAQLEKAKMHRIGEKLVSTSFSLVFAIVLIFGAGEKFSKDNSRWFQFTSSFKQNDNSQNLSNHHYGKDMLKTAEPNSIVMTEGGDNQVFGLLYFSLAERLRPDIDFFDQKGNVFPRLYGDFIGFAPQELELIHFYRDFQLYSTDRPVYLTWERKEIEKIHLTGLAQKKESIINNINFQIANSSNNPNAVNYFNNVKQRILTKFKTDNFAALVYTIDSMIPKNIYSGNLRSGGNLYQQTFKTFGPWYLKPTGLLFKVTPFHYAFADVLLNFGGELKKDRLFSITAKKTKISPTQFNYQTYLDILTTEGFSTQSNDRVFLKKEVSFFKKTKNDEYYGMSNLNYWETYNFSFLKIPNATAWDTLSRQIFSQYLIRHASALTDKAANLRLYATIAKLKNTKNETAENMLKKSTEYSDSAYFLRSKLFDFAQDNPNYLASVAQVFFEQKEFSNAINSYVMSARTNPGYSHNLVKANSIAMQNIYPLLKSTEKKKKLLKQVIARHYYQIERRKLFLRFKNIKNSEINKDTEITEANIKIEFTLKLLNTL